MTWNYKRFGNYNLELNYSSVFSVYSCTGKILKEIIKKKCRNSFCTNHVPMASLKGTSRRKLKS